MRQKLPSFLYERKFSLMAREQNFFCNATDLPLGNVGSIIIHWSYHVVIKFFICQVGKILDTIYVIIISLVYYFGDNNAVQINSFYKF